MTVPNFLIIGNSKSGTTSLYHYLKQHPKIYMSPVKEPEFFAYGNVDSYHYDGPVKKRIYVKTWSEYMQLFTNVTNEIAIGEASTSNIFPRACKRIYQHAPHAKLVTILRQPADKIYSQFLHTRRLGLEPHANLALALQDESMDIRKNWHQFLCYQQSTFTYPNLANFYRTFNSDQIRVYLYDDWESKPLVILQDFFKFIGVDPTFVPDMSTRHNLAALPRSQKLFNFIRQPPTYLRKSVKLILPKNIRRYLISELNAANHSKKVPPISPVLRRKITEMYREDILKTQELIGKDLSHWLS